MKQSQQSHIATIVLSGFLLGTVVGIILLFQRIAERGISWLAAVPRVTSVAGGVAAVLVVTLVVLGLGVFVDWVYNNLAKAKK